MRLCIQDTTLTDNGLRLLRPFWSPKKVLPFTLVLWLTLLTAYGQMLPSTQKLVKSERDAFWLGIGLNYRQVAIDGQWKALPLYQLRFDAMRISFDLSGNENTVDNPLYYSLNRGTFQSISYGYRLLTLNAKFGLLVKTFQLGRGNLVQLWTGYSLTNYSVNEIDPNFLVGLGSPTDFVQVKRMAGTLEHEAFVALDKPFWLKNREFSLRLTGFIPIKWQPATLSAYQQGGDDLLVNPTMRNWVDLTLSYSLIPRFRMNPLKMKPL